MKYLLSTMVVASIVSASPMFLYGRSHAATRTHIPCETASTDGKMTDSERAALIEELTKTKADFIASIKDVTPAQWNFKPYPWVWSVGETAEHIILSEDLLFGVSQNLLKTPARPRLSTSNTQGDQKLETMVEDRTHKVFNPDALKPTGRFKTPADAIAEFTKRRDRNIEYVRTTQDELRAHFSPPSRLGQLDAYQYLVLMAAHSGRHTAQIREVEANPKFPKSE